MGMLILAVGVLFFGKYVVGGGEFSSRHGGVLLAFVLGKYVVEFGAFS